MAVGPTLQQVNWVKRAAALAYEGSQFLADLLSFLATAQASSQVGGIATADWTAAGTPPAPAPFQGLGSADFANFQLALQAIQGALSTTPAGATCTVQQAFQGLAERK